MHQEPQPPNDPLSQQLRAALRRQRPPVLRNVACLLVLLAIPIGLLIWWLAPRPLPPRLGIVAGDTLALPKAEVTLHAYLEAIDNAESARLQGQEILFEEMAAPLPGQNQVVPRRTTSDANGTGTMAWPFSGDVPQVDFLVRHVDAPRRRSAEDRARVFFRPADTPLLLVDVQATLSAATAAMWDTANILEIPVRPGAGAGLQALKDRQYQVVYLALEANRPSQYRKVRAWVDHRFVMPPAFPVGPVLGRPHFTPDDDTTNLRRAVLAELRQRFKSQIVVVVGETDSAAVARELGLSTFWLGEGPPPAGVEAASSWTELVKKVR